MERIIHKRPVRRVKLGVAVQDITNELAEHLNYTHKRGALIKNITKDSPADKAGLKVGDIIMSFDGRRIRLFS